MACIQNEYFLEMNQVLTAGYQELEGGQLKVNVPLELLADQEVQISH
jgi:hypothetical protein